MPDNVPASGLTTDAASVSPAHSATATTAVTAPVAPARPTTVATVGTKPLQPGQTGGDPVFLAVIGVVLVLFFIAVIVMGVKTLRMRKQQTDDDGDDERHTGIVTNWPGLNAPDDAAGQGPGPGADPFAAGSPVPGSPLPGAPLAGSPVPGSNPPGSPLPGTPPAAGFPTPPGMDGSSSAGESFGTPRFPTEPGVVPLPDENIAAAPATAPPGPAAPGTPLSSSDDDDPINRLLLDLEARPPTPPPQPALTPADAFPAAPATADAPGPASFAAPAAEPVAAPVGEPQPFAIPPADGGANGLDSAVPDVSALLSHPPGSDPFAAASPLPTGDPFDAAAAVFDGSGQPAPGADQAVASADPTPDDAAIDPINSILADLSAASTAGPPPYEAPPVDAVPPPADGTGWPQAPSAPPVAGGEVGATGGLEDILARAAEPGEADTEQSIGLADILARAEPVDEAAAGAAPAPAGGAIPPEICAAEPLAATDVDIQQFEELYGADPSNSSILDFLATEYLERGYIRRALFAYQKITEADETRFDAHFHLADCQVKLGLLEDAFPHLQLVLNAPETDPETRASAQALMHEVGAFADEPAVAAAAVAAPAETAAPSPTEPGLQPGLEKKTKALSDALEQQEIMTVYGGQDDTGIEAVKAQLDADPDNPMLLDWYAFQLYSNNHLIEAIQAYRRLVTEFEATPNALYYLGNAFLKMFNYREAKQYWEQLRSDFPRSKLVAKAEKKLERIHALARRELEKRKKAKQAGKKGGLGRISPKRAAGPAKKKQEPLSAIGAILDQHAADIAKDESEPIFTEYVMGDGSGVDEVENLLAADPDNVELLDWAAFMNYTNHSYDKALEQYRRVLELNEDNPQAYYYLGSIYGRLEQFDKAVSHWEVLVQKYPTHKVTAKAKPKLEKMRSKASAQVSSAPSASTATAPNDTAQPARGGVQQTIAKIEQEMPDVRELGEAEREQLFTQYAEGDGSGADEIEALLAKDPDNLQLLDWAAFMNYTAGNYDLALKHYKRCLQLDPKNPQTFYYVGSTLARLERYKEAEPFWQKVVNHFPNHKVAAKTRPKLEKIRELLGATDSVPPQAAAAAHAPPPGNEGPQMTPEQEQALERLMEQNTRDIDEDERRSLVSQVDIPKETMLGVLDAALPRVPDSPELLDWAAYLQYACGHYDRALQRYSKLLKLQPDSPQAYYYIGIILCQQERFADAIKYWNVLVKKYPNCKLAAVTKPNLEKLAVFVTS